MEIKFTKRQEKGLHCRFCGDTLPKNLFETSPIKGIVCGPCMEHLKDYTDHPVAKQTFLSKDDLYEIEKILDVFAGTMSEALNRYCQTAVHYDIKGKKDNPLNEQIQDVMASRARVKEIRDKLEHMRLEKCI